MKSQTHTDKIVTYWLESANEDTITMQSLFNSKRYNWALFIGHLVVEKHLKAYFFKNMKETPPFTHDLLRLAELSNLELNEEQKDVLDQISTFNINARYDNYKQNFYKKCTPEFSLHWFTKINEIVLWIKTRL